MKSLVHLNMPMTFLTLITPHMNKFVMILGHSNWIPPQTLVTLIRGGGGGGSSGDGDGGRWWRRWWRRGRRSLTLAARSFRCTNVTCNHSCNIKCNCTLTLTKPAVSTDHVAWGSREWHTQNHHIKTTFCSNCLGNWSITSSIISCASPKPDSGKHTLPGPRNT